MDVVVEEFDEHDGYLSLVGAVDGVDERVADARQHHLEERGVGVLEVLHEGRQGDALDVEAVAAQKVADRQERVGVDIVKAAHVGHFGVAEAECDVEAADDGQQQVVVADELAHVVLCGVCDLVHDDSRELCCKVTTKIINED